MQRQQFLVVHFWQSIGWIVTSVQTECIGQCNGEKATDPLVAQS
jgi:hypothetical protein